MSELVEILVPEDGHTELPLDVTRLEGVSVRSSPTSRPTSRRLVVASIDVLSSSDYMERLRSILEAVAKHRQTRHLALVLRAAKRELPSDLAWTAFRLLEDLHDTWFRQSDPMLYSVPDDETMRRLVNARRMGAEDKLIASASLLGRELIVWSCEPRMYRVSVDKIPTLAALTKSALPHFSISQSGSRLHWDGWDVDINLDTIRELVDHAFRRSNERRARQDATRFAKAIRTLREKHNLRQSDVSGLSEREVRRLESGKTMPHSETLKKLAAAHQLNVGSYVDTLAKLASTIRPSRRSRRSSAQQAS